MCPPKKNKKTPPGPRCSRCSSSRAMLQLVDVMERLRQLLSFVEIFYKSGCDLDRKCLKWGHGDGMGWKWNGIAMDNHYLMGHLDDISIISYELYMGPYTLYITFFLIK